MKLFAIISACLVASAGGAYYFTTASTCSKGTCDLPVAKSGGCCATATDTQPCCPNPCPDCATSCPDCCAVCCATDTAAPTSCCEKNGVTVAAKAKAKASCCATPCPDCVAKGCESCAACDICCGAAKAVAEAVVVAKKPEAGCCAACDVTPARTIVLASKSIADAR